MSSSDRNGGPVADRVSRDSASVAPDRFDIKEKLGAGGMGVVFRAYDRERRMDVALKILRRLEGGTLYRFKKEFRWVADMVHPNLVTLYELASTGSQWFFTMELIDGVSFLDYVRPHKQVVRTAISEGSIAGPLASDGNAGADDTHSTVTSATPSSAPEKASDGLSSSDPLSPARQRIIDARLDPDRLRAATAQLVAAIEALHAAGKLHRDIKPSNVMVTREGRVVVCDFGLVANTRVDDQTMEQGMVGTPAYMAPEQIAGQAGNAGSDWYAVGVMLYEALTGRQPFGGARQGVLERKLTSTPEPPRTHDPAIPAELDNLVVGLLDRDPERRPTAAEIRRVMGLPQASVGADVARTSPIAEAALVGRDAELATLRQALADSREHGRAVAAMVHGLSGMGKTALARWFLDELATDATTIVLEGRCYQRESVPFKALDALVDALSNLMMRLSADELAEILPRDTTALVRLFPVLERVPAVAEAGELAFAPADPHELRRRAFAALRVLLARLAERRPLVLFIDDLQWGDLDSAGFLSSVLYRDDSPAVLFLATYRRDERDTSPLLQALLSPVSPVAPGDVRDIPLGALSDSAARELIAAVAGARSQSPAVVDALVRESGGNPLFLTELAHSTVDEAADDVRLETVLGNRIARLAKPIGDMLATLAVAAQPTPIGVAARAAGVTDENTALVTLLSARLIRSRELDGEQRLECYHNRIRETLVADLDPAALRGIHRRLARALEASPHPDVLALVDHWQGAGDRDKAGHYAAQAGEIATRALAFDRAATNYRLALDLLEPAGAERCAALRRLADALTNTGLLADAAEVFAEAAGLAQADEALELNRRAMESFVRAGKFEDCLAHARGLLADVGLKLPESPTSALLSVAKSRLVIKLRGLRFRERSPADVPRATMRRMEVCWSLAGGLAFIEPILGSAFQMRHLRLALRAGDPNHVALALAYEVSFRAVAGYGETERCEAIAARTQELAARIGHDFAVATTHVTNGLAAFLTGRWQLGRERFELGQQLLAKIATGVTWEADIAVLFHLASLLYLGELRAMTRLVPLLLQEADERGNQYLAVGLRSWRNNVAWLVLDQPEVARAQLTRAGELLQLTDDNFHLPHYYRMLGRVQTALYCGEGDAAWTESDAGYRSLQRSLIKRIQMTRIEAAFLYARAALTTAHGDDADARLKVAAKMARRMAKEACPWADALAEHTRALVALARGDEAEAARRLVAAVEAFDALDMRLMAAAARWRLGGIGGEHAEARALAVEYASAQDIVAPERFLGMYAPVPVER